jgi:hypothetical protein
MPKQYDIYDGAGHKIGTARESTDAGDFAGGILSFLLGGIFVALFYALALVAKGLADLATDIVHHPITALKTFVICIASVGVVVGGMMLWLNIGFKIMERQSDQKPVELTLVASADQGIDKTHAYSPGVYPLIQMSTGKAVIDKTNPVYVNDDGRRVWLRLREGSTSAIEASFSSEGYRMTLTTLEIPGDGTIRLGVISSGSMPSNLRASLDQDRPRIRNSSAGTLYSYVGPRIGRQDLAPDQVDALVFKAPERLIPTDIELGWSLLWGKISIPAIPVTSLVDWCPDE